MGGIHDQPFRLVLSDQLKSAAPGLTGAGGIKRAVDRQDQRTIGGRMPLKDALGHQTNLHHWPIFYAVRKGVELYERMG